MASNGTPFRPFIERLHQNHWALRHIAEEATSRLADALVEELNQRTPGPEKNPLNTGNLKRALTMRTPVRRQGHIYSVGVGNLDLLGSPAEKAYEPEPIRRFLDWYRGQQAEDRERRRQEQERRRAEREAKRPKPQPPPPKPEVVKTRYQELRELAERRRKLRDRIHYLEDMEDSYAREIQEYTEALMLAERRAALKGRLPEFRGIQNRIDKARERLEIVRRKLAEAIAAYNQIGKPYPGRWW